MISGALHLIKNYSDSEDEDNEGECNLPRHYPDNTNKLPLPNAVKDLFQETNSSNFVDDSALHDGRIRSFKHERGNWPSLLYIPYEIDSESCTLLCSKIISDCANIACFKICSELHISLSRTIVFRHHWIDMFVQSARDRISVLNKFAINFDSLKVYCNEEKTRTFIGLSVSLGNESLLECVRRIDMCLAEFKLPTFYTDASFHVSLVWCLGDVTTELDKLLPRLQNSFDDLSRDEDIGSWIYTVDKVVCKIGNKMFSIGLSGN